MKTVYLSPVDAILKYATTKNTEGCETRPGKTQIHAKYHGEGLGRVWNDGNGFIAIAEFHKNGNLVLNSLFLRKSEITELKEKITVPYVLVEYGYPDYYNESLSYQFDKMKTKEDFINNLLNK